MTRLTWFAKKKSFDGNENIDDVTVVYINT